MCRRFRCPLFRDVRKKAKRPANPWNICEKGDDNMGFCPLIRQIKSIRFCSIYHNQAGASCPILLRAGRASAHFLWRREWGMKRLFSFLCQRIPPMTGRVTMRNAPWHRGVSVSWWARRGKTISAIYNWEGKRWENDYWASCSALSWL